MKDLNDAAFTSLFKEAFQKCFGFTLANPLSETESKHFANKIFEDTGLVIGAKSIKNYSFYIINGRQAKQENPSVATLDTLARYVLNAPYSSETERKDKDGHYPWWFQYKSGVSIPVKKERKNRLPVKSFFLIAACIVFAIFAWQWLSRTVINKSLTDNFYVLQEDSLKQRGWFVKAKDSLWWGRREEKASQLTLFTLRGDNWPDSANSPVIKNLLLRKIPAACFTAEIHMNDFMPQQNWQQAGILLMEDTNFASKTLRLSIAYNDFFGGYRKPGEIIIQGVSSANNFSKPEEIAHIPVFTIEPGLETLVHNNLRYGGLRIEKKAGHFRFLYSIGPVENFAFKEAFSTDLTIEPKYIGIFALQGFVNGSNYIPAHFNFFSITGIPCEK